MNCAIALGGGHLLAMHCRAQIACLLRGTRCDYEYCKSTEFGRPLINSIFTLGQVIGLSVQETTLGTTVANLGISDTRFPAPVFAGDTIRSRTTVKEMRESRSRPNA